MRNLPPPANFRLSTVHTSNLFNLHNIYKQLNSVPLLLCRTEDAVGVLPFDLLTSSSALKVYVKSIVGLDFRRTRAGPLAEWAEASAMQPMHLATNGNGFGNGTGCDSSSLAV